MTTPPVEPVSIVNGCPCVNLAGRRCRRSAPHKDWCCDFEPLAETAGGRR